MYNRTKYLKGKEVYRKEGKVSRALRQNEGKVEMGKLFSAKLAKKEDLGVKMEKSYFLNASRNYVIKCTSSHLHYGSEPNEAYRIYFRIPLHVLTT